MKAFLIAIAAILFVSTAEAEWKSKPVMCDQTSEIFRVLLDPYEVKPMFAAVENVRRFDGNYQPAVIVFFMNIDNGKFLLLETDDQKDMACVIEFGDGMDFNITESEIREFLLDESGT